MGKNGTMVGGYYRTIFQSKQRSTNLKNRLKNPYIYRLKLSEKRAYGRGVLQASFKRLIAELNRASLLIAAKCL